MGTPIRQLRARMGLGNRAVGPSENGGHHEAKDRWALGLSLLLSLAFGALAMLYSLVLYRFQYEVEHGVKTDVWYQGGDIWMLLDAGRFVWHGALGYVYMGAGQSYALPVSYILIAPLSALVDHFRLVEALVPLRRPSAWPLAACFVLLFNAFILDVIRRMSWDLGLRRRLWAVQLATVLIVCVPVFQFGHFEDVLALTFAIQAMRYAFADRILAASLVLSVAIGCKQWAVLLVPLVVIMAPHGRRLVSLSLNVALPLLLAALVLLTDPSHGYAALFAPANPRRTDPGHMSVFFTWFGSKTSRTMRTISILLSPVVAFLFRKRRKPVEVLTAASVLLLLRPLFEPLSYAYYWMPSLLLAGLVGVAAHRKFRVRDWIWQVLAILWSLPHSNPHDNATWWVVQLGFIVLTWVQVASNNGLDLKATALLGQRVRLPFAQRLEPSYPSAEELVSDARR